MAKVIERVYEYLQLKGIKPRTAEIELHLSNGFIGKSLNRGSDVGTEFIEKFCNHYQDVSLEWLVMGVGHPYKHGLDPKEQITYLECLEKKSALSDLLIEKENEIKRLKSVVKYDVGELNEAQLNEATEVYKPKKK